MRIYRITNKLNNKVYIGQTKGSIEDRFIQHCNNQESVSAITAAIKKYGRENFYIEELAKADNQSQLDQLEKTYIQLNNSMAPVGYNLKTGGLEGSIYSEQSKYKMSVAKKGKTVSEETRCKMSASHKKRLSTDEKLRKFRGEQYRKRYQSDINLQKKFSYIREQYWSIQENRNNASVRAKASMTDERRNFISQQVKKSHNSVEIKNKMEKVYKEQRKKVVRSDGVIFDSVKDAAMALNIMPSNIVKNLKGKYKTVLGYTFNYLLPEEQNILPIKPTVYLLVGAPGAGKSWVANQLLDKYDYISYDSVPKKEHLDRLRTISNKPKLYDPTFKISTIIRRHSNEFNFILVSIYEDEETLRKRISERGGEWTDTILKRNEVARKRYEKYGTGGFIGTSSEAFYFLNSI